MGAASHLLRVRLLVLVFLLAQIFLLAQVCPLRLKHCPLRLNHCPLRLNHCPLRLKSCPLRLNPRPLRLKPLVGRATVKVLKTLSSIQMVTIGHVVNRAFNMHGELPPIRQKRSVKPMRLLVMCPTVTGVGHV